MEKRRTVFVRLEKGVFSFLLLYAPQLFIFPMRKRIIIANNSQGFLSFTAKPTANHITAKMKLTIVLLLSLQFDVL